VCDESPDIWSREKKSGGSVTRALAFKGASGSEQGRPSATHGAPTRPISNIPGIYSCARGPSTGLQRALGEALGLRNSCKGRMVRMMTEQSKSGDTAKMSRVIVRRQPKALEARIKLEKIFLVPTEEIERVSKMGPKQRSRWLYTQRGNGLREMTGTTRVDVKPADSKMCGVFKVVDSQNRVLSTCDSYSQAESFCWAYTGRLEIQIKRYWVPKEGLQNDRQALAAS
jgi:hypothetical protein